jgi:hypothetical protein
MTRRRLIPLTVSIFLGGLLTACTASAQEAKGKTDNPLDVAMVEGKNDKQPVQEKEKKGKIVRTRDLIEFRQFFKQLGIAYATYEAEHNKGPQKKEDLAPSLQGLTKLLEMLDKGDIVFYYGVSKQQMEKGASMTILAHEAYEDVNGRRLVLMGDGSVQELSNAEFEKAPKAKK